MYSSLPDSYSTLPFQHIRVSHVPESSPTPTPIILVTLYRPGKHNAFTETMADDLEIAFDLLSLDPKVKCIVITGHGKMFCPGADLEAGLSYENDTALTHRDAGGRVALAIHRCTKPTIAAINGSAVGVGITKLANDVVKNTSAVSTAIMRDLMWRGPSTAEETHLLDSKILLELFGGEDKKEGIKSFMDKRDPEFKGNMQDNAPSVWPWWKPIDTKPPFTTEELTQRLKIIGVESGKAKL
ncbi:enoyl-CoA hydratase/isomerase family protein [Sclerotinia borealis F-4128]|uniref:Enoyl-CoA hydratase/isomerase family protein n=1 Tax=Sclerotinia borealis (strain F-4128) TaxID=1432307 RepID=W9CU16_SCLBF|nr:enoyl-CoA hydratase/isomerase family protein [Sclerotinia borealis F-4128]